NRTAIDLRGRASSSHFQKLTNADYSGTTLSSSAWKTSSATSTARGRPKLASPRSPAVAKRHPGEDARRDPAGACPTGGPGRDRTLLRASASNYRALHGPREVLLTTFRGLAAAYPEEQRL